MPSIRSIATAMDKADAATGRARQSSLCRCLHRRAPSSHACSSRPIRHTEAHESWPQTGLPLLFHSCRSRPCAAEGGIIVILPVVDELVAAKAIEPKAIVPAISAAEKVAFLIMIDSIVIYRRPSAWRGRRPLKWELHPIDAFPAL